MPKAEIVAYQVYLATLYDPLYDPLIWALLYAPPYLDPLIFNTKNESNFVYHRSKI